jgi:hypothetical protein
MKKYTVDEPEFNKTLIITETTDTGHADNINKAPKMAFENTLYLEKTKLDADGGDISEAVIKAADEIEDDEYPIPASGDKPRTFLGKTKKFLGNIKDWMTGVCLLGQIVNNCVTDNAKLPLSAAQGKALMDLYNVLNTNQQKRPNLTVANVCLKGGGYGRTLCLDGNWFGKVSPAEKDCYYIALDANCKIYIGFQQHSASVITWS